MPAVGALVHDLATSADVEPGQLRSLRETTCGAGDIPPAVLDRFAQRVGLVPQMGYGQTEIPGMVTLTPTGPNRPTGSSGRPLPHVEVAVVNEAGENVAPGTEGEICVRAATTGPWAGMYRPLVEYWNQPDETAEVLRSGCLHTGDLARMTVDGDLVVSGRSSAMIVRGGANVYPAEVERVLSTCDGVAAGVVIGVEDDRLGQRVVALVEAFEEADVHVDRCIERCRDQLAGYKCPERVFVVAKLPRNSLAKVMRPAATAMAIELISRVQSN